MNQSIRRICLTATAACGLLLSPASAQTTATTDPVGAMTVTVPNNSDSALSVPLLGEVVFEGVILSIDSSDTLTLAGSPGFLPNELTSSAHFLEVSSGDDSGMLLTILGNTSQTITVQISGARSLSNLSSSSSVIIRKALVVSDLIPAPPDGLSILLFNPDSPGENKSASDLLFSQGGNWIDAVTFSSANNYLIHPFESVVLRNESGGSFEFSISGNVPLNGMWTNLYVAAADTGQDVRLGVRSPVGVTLNESGISDFAISGDTLLFFDNSNAGLNKSASSLIFYDGSNWIDAVTFQPVGDSVQFEPGVGFVLRLSGRSNTGNIVWRMNQPY